MGLLDLPVELLRPIIRDVVRRPPWTNTDVISLARVNSKSHPIHSAMRDESPDQTQPSSNSRSSSSWKISTFSLPLPRAPPLLSTSTLNTRLS